ncbi:uncharacterized protein PG986_002157 [Apiospora aurea]|uniref:Uncharacterized protein n=1 Tax=Apiospora aurea TaxID=335848 RepID=A0ABR1QYW1_9PEZI
MTAWLGATLGLEKWHSATRRLLWVLNTDKREESEVLASQRISSFFGINPYSLKSTKTAGRTRRRFPVAASDYRWWFLGDTRERFEKGLGSGNTSSKQAQLLASAYSSRNRSSTAIYEILRPELRTVKSILRKVLSTSLGEEGGVPLISRSSPTSRSMITVLGVRSPSGGTTPSWRGRATVPLIVVIGEGLPDLPAPDCDSGSTASRKLRMESGPPHEPDRPGGSV